MTKQELFALSVDVYYKRSTHKDYTAEEREEGLKNYLADLGTDYRENKNKIFALIEETVNEVLPVKVKENIRQFAEFKQYGDNDEIRFVVKNGKIKAVEVALGSRVARQRVDKGHFTMKSSALQVKVYEEYMRVITGLVDWNGLINMCIEAINEAILDKIYNTLISVYSKAPQKNVHTAPTVEDAELTRIVNVVKAYGQQAIIMGTPTALSQIPLSQYASETDKNDMRLRGYLGMYKSCPVVEIQNSFTDGSNETPVLDDSYIFVIPSGSEKVVKVALKGGFHIDESRGKDWTYNFEGFQQAGVGLLAVNNIGVYHIATA